MPGRPLIRYTPQQLTRRREIQRNSVPALGDIGQVGLHATFSSLL